MAEYVDGNVKTFTSGEALALHLRVALSAGTVVLAGVASADIGTVESPALVSGDLAAIRLRSASGTQKFVAAVAIAAGQRVYQAASGKVSNICAGLAIGIALNTVTADGHVVEVLREASNVVPEIGTIAAAGSAQGDAAAIVNHVTYVTAADGTKGVILPAAAAGLRFEVYSTVATNGLKIYPATGDDINDGSANAAITIEGKSHATFVALDDTTWAADYVVNT